MLPALIIGTHTMGLGVIRALGEMNVPVIALYYQLDDMGFVSKYVHERIYVPHPEKDETHFIESLLELTSRFHESPLIPVSDESLKIVSKNKPLLQKYYRVACPEWEIVQKLLEKDFTYELARSVGVPMPRTIVPGSMQEVIASAKDMSFPCLVKPVESHGYYEQFRRKMARVENLAQLITAYQEAEHTGFKVMLQEWIPGGDSLGVIYNSYFWNGQPTVEFTAQKIRSAPPERGSPCVAVSRYIPAVLESGRAFLAAAKFYGYSCTEFKLDPRDGVYKLIEVNGRHNLSTLLAVKCGINFPWLHYYHLAEGSMPQPTLFRENIYWVDLERELSYIPKRVFHHRERLSQILMPYVCPHIFAVYDSRDIKPFIKRYVDFVRKFVYKLIGWRSRSDHPRPRIVNQNN